ncbi:MAG: hypothetical protein ACI9BV_003786 [Rhodothermales bacterium]|jgi:hypothetical protein
MLRPRLDADETQPFWVELGCVAGLVFLTLTFGWAALRLAFPATSLALALYTRWQSTERFIRVLLWIWFLTPFIRRLVDFGLGEFDPLSPVMLAPFIASLVAGLDLIAFGRTLATRRYVPFLLIFLGIAWGYGVGLLRLGFASSTFKMLEWLIPPLLAFSIALREPAADRVWETVRSTLLWAGSLLGLYGVVQFFFLPPWDAFWMVSAETYDLQDVRPMGFRVFSTINSTHPFGSVMMASALLAMSARKSRVVLSGVPAIAGLMLSWTRAAWGGLVVSAVVYWFHSDHATRRQVTRTAALSFAVLLLVFSQTALGPRVAERFSTLSSVSEDYSFQARVRLYIVQGADAMIQPVGRGIGAVGKAAKLSGEAVHLDSTWLSMLFEFGWPGTVLYLTGLGMLLARTVRRLPFREGRDSAAFGLVVGFLAMTAFSNMFVAIKGMLIWIFLGTLLRK